MSHNTVTQIKLLDSRMAMPQYATVGSAGMDLQASLERAIDIYPGGNVKIGTGIAVALLEGYVGLVMPKSGKGSNGYGIKNFTGVIDSDYRGEIIVNIWNTNRDDRENCILRINPLEQIAQLLIMPVVQAKLMLVNEFSSETARGAGGFGSTSLPRLENWVLLNNQIIGNIYGDDRFREGQVIRTTKLTEFSPNIDIAVSQNTKYKLGKKADQNFLLQLSETRVHEESGDLPTKLLPGSIKALRHCSLCNNLFTDSELSRLHGGSWCKNCMPEVV